MENRDFVQVDSIPAEKYPLLGIEVDGITQGALATWLTCPMKATLSLKHGLSGPKYQDALDFGTIVHGNLELLYGWYWEQIQTGSLPNSKDILSTALYFLDTQELAWHKDIAESGGSAVYAESSELNFKIAAATLEHYYRQWDADFNSVEWVSLEKQFRVPYSSERIIGYLGRNELPVRGKIDGIFKSKKGSRGIWLFETKTKGSIEDPSLISRIIFDLQTGLYSWAVRQLYGEHPVGLVYNLIRRPQLRRKSNESINDFVKRTYDDIGDRIDEYFRRLEVTFTINDVVKFEHDLDQIICGFVQWYFGDGPNYRNATQCGITVGNFTRTCEFLNGCANDHWDRFRTKERIYPELDDDLQLAKKS